MDRMSDLHASSLDRPLQSDIISCASRAGQALLPLPRSMSAVSTVELQTSEVTTASWYPKWKAVPTSRRESQSTTLRRAGSEIPSQISSGEQLIAYTSPHASQPLPLPDGSGQSGFRSLSAGSGCPALTFKMGLPDDSASKAEPSSYGLDTLIDLLWHMRVSDFEKNEDNVSTNTLLWKLKVPDSAKNDMDDEMWKTLLWERKVSDCADNEVECSRTRLNNVSGKDPVKEMESSDCLKHFIERTFTEFDKCCENADTCDIFSGDISAGGLGSVTTAESRYEYCRLLKKPEKSTNCMDERFEIDSYCLGNTMIAEAENDSTPPQQENCLRVFRPSLGREFGSARFSPFDFPRQIDSNNSLKNLGRNTFAAGECIAQYLHPEGRSQTSVGSPTLNDRKDSKLGVSKECERHAGTQYTDSIPIGDVINAPTKKPSPRVNSLDVALLLSRTHSILSIELESGTAGVQPPLPSHHHYTHNFETPTTACVGPLSSSTSKDPKSTVKHEMERDALASRHDWNQLESHPVSQRDWEVTTIDYLGESHTEAFPAPKPEINHECKGHGTHNPSFSQKIPVISPMENREQTEVGQSRIPSQRDDDCEIVHKSKRDRTNSTEMLSKPTASLRKKKQKDQDIPVGRLRGTSICTDPQLAYGLAAVHNVLRNLHEDANSILVPKRARTPGLGLLDTELETIHRGEALDSELTQVVSAILRGRTADQLQSETGSDLIKRILELKTRLDHLLEELQESERTTLSLLKDVISRFAFLFPVSATDCQRESLRKKYRSLENLVCQSFRNSLESLKHVPSGGDSTSGQPVHEHISPSTTDHTEDLTVQAQAATGRTAGTFQTITQFESTGTRTRAHFSGARGSLPKAASDYMRNWLFNNFENP